MVSYEDLKEMVFGCLGDIEEGMVEIPEEIAKIPNDMEDHLMSLNSDLASVGVNISNLKKAIDEDWYEGQLQAIKFNLGNFCGYILKVLEKDDISSRDELFGRYFEKLKKLEESFDFFKYNYISALSLMHFQLSNCLRDYLFKQNDVRSRLEFLMISGIGFLRRVMSDVGGEIKGEGVNPVAAGAAAVNDPSEELKLKETAKQIGKFLLIIT